MMSLPCPECQGRLQMTRFNFPYWYFRCHECKHEASYHVGGLPRGLQTTA